MVTPYRQAVEDMGRELEDLLLPRRAQEPAP